MQRGRNERSEAAARETPPGMMKLVSLLTLFAVGWFAAGCSSLPTSGPTVGDVLSQEVQGNQIRFDLVDVNDTSYR